MGLGGSLLDIEPCQYGYSTITFRGPEADLNQPYLAFLGSTETVGPFLTRPFPTLVAERCGLGCVNLGIKNAGPDVYLQDPEITRIANGAEAVILELPALANFSNAYYRVHPRRNDRFVRAQADLHQIAPSLDTTDIHFTGHLLSAVRRAAPRRFPTMVGDLHVAWIKRMERLIAAITAPVHLIRLGRRSVWQGSVMADEARLLRSLATSSASATTLAPSSTAISERTEHMFFEPHEAKAAGALFSRAAHGEIADQILEVLGYQQKTARAI